MSTSETPGIEQIAIDGKQLALLVSASFMLAFWSFKRQEARELLAGEDRTPFEGVLKILLEESTRILSGADAFEAPAHGWTEALAAKRAAVCGTMAMRRSQLRSLILALRVCHAEFGDPLAWVDFCIASPGNIDSYGIVPPDLLILAAELENKTT